MSLDSLKEKVIQSIREEKGPTLEGLKEALTKKHPENTRLYLFDLEPDGEFLSVIAYSAKDITYPFPDPVLVNSVDLTRHIDFDQFDLKEDTDEETELEDELIQFGRKYFIQWFTQCFDEVGGSRYSTPCILRDAYDGEYYHLQEKRWVDFSKEL